jgi:uncharacterized coiled-coil protein SlyX
MTMTENQETQIINMLAEVISEVREVRKTQEEHSAILAEHTSTLARHEQKLDLVIARTDDVANTVLNHEDRLTKVENNVTELRGGIH